MANIILTDERKEQILSKGVRDMPQNPASQGYTKDQIKAFYFEPEKMMLEDMIKIEAKTDAAVEELNKKDGIKERVGTLENYIDGVKDKIKILNVDETKPNRFLSEEGIYKEIKECECVPIVVDKELNENSTNLVENQAIAKAIKGKQDKLTAGKNIKIENGVISAEGGSEVEANPKGEATEDLYKLKVGETVYAIPKEILQGEGAPTTETVGELGQFYTDTLTGVSYKCTTVENSVYTWVEMVDKTMLDKKLDIPSEAGKNKAVIGYNTGSTLPRVFTMGSYIEGKGHNGSIAVYYTNGCLRSPTPINNEDVATKGYVDTAVANAGGGGSGGLTVYKHTFSFTRIFPDTGDLFGVDNGEFLSLKSTKQVEVQPDGVYIALDDRGISIISIPWIEDEGGVYPVLNNEYAASFAGEPCYAYFFNDSELENLDLSETITPYIV